MGSRADGPTWFPTNEGRCRPEASAEALARRGYGARVASADDLRERLEGIAEELADLAMDALRSSIEDGDADARDQERRLTRARRSVEKAAALLAGAERRDDEA